jgi:hypothetical protein
LFVLTALLALAALFPTPAAAHGPNGLFQVQPSTVVAPLTVNFRVRLIYTNDTEPVTSGATVTVQGSGPGGSVGPVAMGYTGTDGYYTAQVAFPAGGTWNITFRSQNPAAQYATTQAVPSPPAPTAPPPPTAAPAPSTTPPATVESTTTSVAPEAVEQPVSTTTTELSTTTTADEGEEIAATPAASSTESGYQLAYVGLGALAAIVVLGSTVLVAAKARGS